MKNQLPLFAFYEWEEKTPEKVFLRQPRNGQYDEYTWKQVSEHARRVATYLKSKNIPEKSKIAILSKNCAEWVMSDLAIMMADHVSVPMFPNLTHDSVLQILEHSGSKLIFIGKLDDYSVLDVLPDDILKVSFPGYGPNLDDTWDKINASHEPMQGQPLPAPEDLAIIMYTSGTTGKQKGVMHTHANLGFAGKRYAELFGYKPEDRLISHLPMCHAAEKVLIQMASYYGGNSLSFVESPETFLENLKEVRPTFFGTVPRLWTKFQMGVLAKIDDNKLGRLLKIPVVGSLVKGKIKKSLGLDKARMFVGGAAPLQPSMLDWYKRLGILIREIYGMTENVTWSHGNFIHEIKLGTVGKVLPECEAKLSDEGEVLIKNDALMIGYYKEPQLTAEAFTEDKYLKTGDIGEMDEDGYLRIVGRIKDQFKTSRGKYISPATLEERLNVNSYVEQVCVVGAGLSMPIGLIVLSEVANGVEKSVVESDLNTLLIEVNAGLAPFEQLKCLVVVGEEWTPENEFLTPTLKLKRRNIEAHYGPSFKKWYESRRSVYFEETQLEPEIVEG